MFDRATVATRDPRPTRTMMFIRRLSPPLLPLFYRPVYVCYHGMLRVCMNAEAKRIRLSQSSRPLMALSGNLSDHVS